MSSSPPPAADPKQQLSADVTPNGVKHPSADEASATDLAGSPPSAVESPAAADAPASEKTPSVKALNGELFDSSSEGALSTGTGFKGSPPSAVESPAAADAPASEKTPSVKALNGELFDSSSEEALSTGTGFKGATPSAVEEKHAAAVPPVAEKPLPSEKTPSNKVATSAKPSAWIEVRSCRYFLGVPDSHGAVLFVALVTVLYALLTPWLLRRVAGQPTGFVWTVSILAGSYFFIGAVRFSVTMGFLAIFFRISYAALLSVAATHFISSNSGAAVATLLTFYAAGIFGHALAEYVQRAESEAMFTPPSGCKGDQSQQSGAKDDRYEQSSGAKDDQCQQSSGAKDDQCQQSSGAKDDLNQLDEPLMCFLFVHGVLSLLVLVRMVWVVLRPGSAIFMMAIDNHDSEISQIVEEFSFEMLFVIWPWACFVAVFLQEGFVVSLNTMVYKVPGAAAALYILSAVLSVALGKAYGLLAFWPAPMAMAGLFGYTLAMFARYHHIRASLSQIQQPMSEEVLDKSEQKGL